MAPEECYLASPYYDEVLHLGYLGWPAPTLREDMARRAALHFGLDPVVFMRGIFDEPWLKVEPAGKQGQEPLVSIGFTDEWVELKAGILHSVNINFHGMAFCILVPPDSRLATEFGFRELSGDGLPSTTVLQAAQWIAASDLFLGDCSALWVVANGLGKPTVIVEPAEARATHPVFWFEHSRNTMVRGGDGKPTFDARAVVEAVRKRVEG